MIFALVLLACEPRPVAAAPLGPPPRPDLPAASPAAELPGDDPIAEVTRVLYRHAAWAAAGPEVPDTELP